MTAEIAILNRHGVALATDSAVTLDGPDEPLRIFNSANKLFVLLDNEPVGIMVYGNSAFCGISWEVLIKSFRASHAKAQPSIDLYISDLVDWLRLSVPSIVPEVVLEAQIIGSANEVVLGALPASGVSPPPATFEALVDSIRESLHAAIAAIRTEDFALKFDSSDLPNAAETYGPHLQLIFKDAPSHYTSDVRKAVLEDEETKALAVELGANALVRAIKTQHSSGLVVAGFGTEQLFPEIAEYLVYGYLDGRLKYIERRHEVVSYDNDAVVVPFVEESVVASLMSGADIAYTSQLDRIAEEAQDPLSKSLRADLLTLDVNPLVADAIAHHLQRSMSVVIQFLDSQMSEFRRTFERSLLSNIARMPKEELPAVAEALVTLASLRRRTDGAVGGPIDTALISRGDGFVWIKRKHYFDPELNPRFMARHYANRYGAGRS